MNNGINYFPLNVHLDDKFELIEAEFGLKGFAIVVKLFQKIYGQQGYYCEWTEDVALLFGKNVGLGGDAVSEIVRAAIKRGIFDSELYDKYQILTSRGIQERYFEAVSRRKEVEVRKEYLLIKVDQIYKNVRILNENVNISSKNVNISEQKKVEESKAKESRALPPLTPPGESGGAQGNPDLDIPGYAYNRNTHNLECLMLNLEKLYITDREEIRKILKLSDYGRLGNYVWKIFNGTNWSKVNSKGGYIISVLAREKRSTGS